MNENLEVKNGFLISLKCNFVLHLFLWIQKVGNILVGRY